MENAASSDEPHAANTATTGRSNSDQMHGSDASQVPVQSEPDWTRTEQESYVVEQGKEKSTSASTGAEEPMTTGEGETGAQPATTGAAFHADVISEGVEPPSAAPSSLPAGAETLALPGNPSAAGHDLSQPSAATSPTVALENSPTEPNPSTIPNNTNGGHFDMATHDDIEKEFGSNQDDNDDDDDDDNIRYTDEDIQRDASSIAVMAMVNVALLFFAGLFVCAIAGSILFTSQFGFVTLCIVLCLVGIVVGTVAWIGKIVTSDEKLRPVQRKMRRWRAIAKAVVVNEMIAFRLDMQEHLLLTDGGEYEDDDYYEKMDANDTNNNGTSSGQQIAPTATHSSTRNANNSKSRSVIFGLMVKPFIKGGKKMRRKLGRKKNDKNNTAAATNEAESSTYVPPAAGTEMV